MAWLFKKLRKKFKKKKAPVDIAYDSIAQAASDMRNKVSFGEGLKEGGKSRVLFRGPKTFNNSITIGKNFHGSDFSISVRGSGHHIIIGDDVALKGSLIVVGKHRMVRIGHRTSARGVSILARDANVSIGDDCLLSREIEIRASDVHKIYDIETKEHINPGKDVVIGNRVWIAARAFLSKGAQVPSGSVVGAMSFVNKAFGQENCVYAGVPAKMVRQNIRWKR